LPWPRWATELLILRTFPNGGLYPFRLLEFIPALAFCATGIVLTWGVERATVLWPIFAVYAVACVTAYVVPSELEENIARLRFLALPICVLVLALRQWRPSVIGAIALALALAWNLSPLLASYASGRSDPSSDPAYWAPAISYLKQRLTPSYRVEVVDTSGHWEAVYLPTAGIPIVRGWFRQDDFPQNRMLYQHPSSHAYLRWLRGLGVRYVVLTEAPPDYSAQAESALLRSGRSGLAVVLRMPQLTVYAVPSPRAIITGPRSPRVVALTQERVRVDLSRPGRYRLAIRYSAYWQAPGACIAEGSDGMTVFSASRGGLFDLEFDVDAGRLLASLEGDRQRRCSS
jgi:hypothetical protein